MAVDFTPYTTVDKMILSKAAWIPDELDKQRIGSYEVYERIYWSVPETFAITARGTEDNSIYLPDARTIVETINRYTATGFSFFVQPRPGVNPGDEQATLQATLDTLFRRERFFSQFLSAKRYGIIRGDWLWHITADERRLPGTRITIRAIDPGTYFPITHPDDIDRVIGCHLVDQIVDGDEIKLHRLTYRRTLSDAGIPTGQITVEEAVMKLDENWQTAKPIQIIQPPKPLPAQITALPVYHVRNFEEPQNPFGSSELRGMEVILGALNQAISDEELSLAMNGLGLYVTTAPEPVNDEGDNIGWVLGPAQVVQVPVGHSFERANGITSVQPYQDHMGFLRGSLREAAALSDIATGLVDVKSAPSGISLALQLAPILTRAEEKDQVIRDIHTQMYFDIVNGWLPAYESLSFAGSEALPDFGSKVPVDREAKREELNDMLDRKVISTEFYRSEMRKLGYVFPDGMAEDITNETRALAAATDAFGDRLNEESRNGQTQDQLQ